MLDALSATNRSPFGAEGSPPFQQCSVSILGCGGGRAGIRQHKEGGGRCPYDVMHSNAPSGLDEPGHHDHRPSAIVRVYSSKNEFDNDRPRSSTQAGDLQSGVP